MEEYNLEPGEFLILESQDARIKLASGDALDRIALTNRSLILVKTQARGLFDRARMLKRCPLSKIERTYDEAQINLTKRGTKYMLNIPFSDECISLLFDDGQGTIARNWAESIRKAANGDLNSIREEETTPLEQIRGSFLEAFGNIGISIPAGANPTPSPERKAPRKPAKPIIVANVCKGCHAPIQGEAGHIATCDWCGTTQTIKE